MPWTCDAADVPEPERVAPLAQPDTGRDRRAAAGTAVGRLGRRCRASAAVGARAGRRGRRHGARCARAGRVTSGRRPPPARPRRRSCGPGRWRRPRRPRASAPRSRAVPAPSGLSRSTLAEPVALEPDEHALVLAPPAGRLERLEVERQVRLEVVVEGAPAVADAAGQPRPGRRLAADDDPRRRVRDRVGGRRPSAGSTATRRVTGPPVHSARMTATASSSRATRSGGSGKSMP